MSHSFRPVDSGVLSNLIGYNLRRGYFLATQLFTELFADKEITPIQFAVLNVIALDDSLSQKDVAANIGSRPQALVPLIRDLEQRGLILRTRSEADRRHHHLSLTENGRELTAELNQLIPEVENRLLQGFSGEERQSLLLLLTKLVDTQSQKGGD